jgi:hypothetical protein
MGMTRLMTRMAAFCVAMVALAVLLFAMVLAHAAKGETNYGGRYELVDGKAGRTFSLVVNQKKSRAEVSFSAAMADGSGAAPDGTGKGQIEDGVLSFAFKDSFDNEGTCTLSLGKSGGYNLSITVIKVVNPSPFHFYGNILLKRASGGSE